MICPDCRGHGKDRYASRKYSWLFDPKEFDGVTAHLSGTDVGICLHHRTLFADHDPCPACGGAGAVADPEAEENHA